MSDKPDFVGAATLFNSFAADWGNRVNTFVNYLIVVTGGILSITIGAFLSGKPPALSPAAMQSVRYAWFLLSSGLVLALLTTFLHIIAQATTVIRMRRESQADGAPGLVTIHGPFLLRVVIWLVFCAAFFCSVSGIVCISHGASQLLLAGP